jgi:hypothetical protein
LSFGAKPTCPGVLWRDLQSLTSGGPLADGNSLTHP